MKKVARIFEELTGQYHICDNDADILDARGPGYSTKADAMRNAALSGYTHVTGSGTYWNNRIQKIPLEYRAQ